MKFSTFRNYTIVERLRVALIFSFLLSIQFVFSSAANAQTIGWGTPQRDSSNPMGGEVNRTGVGVTIFNGSLWVAFDGTTTVDSSADQEVYVVSNPSGSSSFGTAHLVTLNGNAIITNANPSLAVYNSYLVLAYNVGGQNRYIYSSDGSNWQSGGSCSSDVDASPNMAVSGAFLVIALRQKSTQLAQVCYVKQDWTNNGAGAISPDAYINFDPAIAASSSGNLVVAAESQDNHNLNLWVNTTGDWVLDISGTVSNDQTSTAPTLAFHKNVLYLGFRTNDSDDKFLYKYSSDMNNFSGAIDPHWQIGGPPALISADSLAYSSYNGQMFMIFSSNTSVPNYLCSNHGN